MDITKTAIGLITALAIAGTSLPSNKSDGPIDGGIQLVGSWPAAEVGGDSQNEFVNDLVNPKFDELNKRADRFESKLAQLQKDTAAASDGLKSFRPKTNTDSAPADGDYITRSEAESLFKTMFSSEYQVQKQIDFQQASGNGSSGGGVRSGGGSSGGTVVQGTYQPTYQQQSTYQPAYMQTVASTSPVRSATSTRDYQASNGCTVRETRYSDGTVSRETISCPLQQNGQTTNRGWYLGKNFGF